MSFTFEDAEVVKSAGGGRKAAENPFTTVIGQIALAKNDKGKPVAKSFPLESPDEETHVTDVNRARRQLTDAGKENTPAVSVHSRVATEPGGLKSVITFWTGDKIVRQVKPKN